MFVRLWDREFSKTVDSLSIEKYHIKQLTLMENAGKAVFKHIAKLSSSRPVIILAGPGNNGGDALVAARYLLKSKIKTYIFLVGHNHKLTEACKIQVEKIKKIKNAAIFNYTEGSINKLQLKKPIIVDGILGIGVKGELRDDLVISALTEASQIADATVVAVDVPSGMDIDNPGITKIPLKAHICVTFGGLKPAHIIAPSNLFCEKIVVEDIKFSKDAIVEASQSIPPVYEYVEADELIKMNPLASLSKNAHKYDRGHVLVIGGSYGKIGAPILCAKAALKSGCGWVSIALSSQTLQDFSPLVTAPTEATFENLFDKHSNLDAQKLEHFINERFPKAIVIGPGFVKQELNEKIINILVEYSNNKKGFLVFDAGAIYNLKNLISDKKFCLEKTIITPHPGEWLKFDMKTPLPSPLSATNLSQLQNIVQQCGITLGYKSSTPMVISAQGSAKVINTANNILARAGSGDVLAGIIATQGIHNLSSSIAFLRSQAILFKAALLAAKDCGHHSVLATDIIDKIGLVT